MNEIKGYAVIDLGTGETRFMLLAQEQWNAAYKQDEIKGYLHFMNECGLSGGTE